MKRSDESIKIVRAARFFLLELGSLASYGYWGFHAADGQLLRILLGIETPLVVTVFWGVVLSPKAKIPVKPPLRLILQLIVFTGASWALYAAGQSALAFVLLAVTILTMILTILLKTYQS
ncbi:YrdB family protein [Paenibacillus humicola]|uniref:YrdB family protein n=1 Tax=Paenibacillus humicola TaxID=3110540 RepID=UPI003B82E87F